MITRCTLVVLLILSSSNFYAQDSLKIKDDTQALNNPTKAEMGRFSLSVNPASVIFFGPMLNAEVGIGKHVRFNTHVRYPNGLISQLYYSAPEKLFGYGIGAGLMGFFGKKGNWGKLSLGLLVEYSKTTAEYYYDPLSSYYTGGSHIDEIYVCAFQAGYRFRFNTGYFIHMGMYFFLPFYPDWPNHMYPLPQPDIRFGFEF